NLENRSSNWIYEIKRHDTLLLPDESEVLDETLRETAEQEYQESKKLFDELYEISSKYGNIKLGQINAPESVLRKVIYEDQFILNDIFSCFWQEQRCGDSI